CDGNYRVVRDLVWARATAVVWLDYALPVVMGRVLARTLRRGWRRETLWAGNRESLRKAFLSRESILWWALSTWRDRRRRYGALFEAGGPAGVHRVRLRRPADAERLCRTLARAPAEPAAHDAW
ncbi:MAG: toxin, partial [Myxococcota bacterium]|nr:toxin [Myxococcota bacterium]